MFRFDEYQFHVSEYLQNKFSEIKALAQDASKKYAVPRYIISMGAFDQHNLARKRSYTLGCQLVTIPIPLANDSFCTNRCDKGNAFPSYRCHYPRYIIFDKKHLELFSLSSHVLGVGEYIGLYSSVIDYFEMRRVNVPVNLMQFIADLFSMLCYSYSSSYPVFIKFVALALLLKCFCMRIAQDHEIGCGIDHLIGYYLEESFGFSHGKAIYWATIFSLGLFPEWEDLGISIKNLILNGLKLGIITVNELETLQKLNFPIVIGKSISTRPDRITSLKKIANENWRIANLTKELGKNLFQFQNNT